MPSRQINEVLQNKKIELVARTVAATSRRRKRGYYNNGMEVHFIFLAQTVKKPC